jgi:Ca-activated chloride channel family protein
MSGSRTARSARVLALGACVILAGVVGLRAVDQQQEQQQPPVRAQGYTFRSGVDLINVTVTVTDSRGRFVSGLGKDDFTVYEDGKAQAIAYFASERVPVSLGIALDTSGSMEGDKLVSARAALNRFLNELTDPDDEFFLYRIADRPVLVQGWTSDREQLRKALAGISARGGTALIDTVAEALPLAQTGKHQKKALVIISDGNDTASQTDPAALRQLIRETEVLIYAVGIDGRTQVFVTQGPTRTPPRFPWPFPGRGGGGGGRPTPWPPGPTAPGVSVRGDPLNAGALREMTDDSGGRTEIIRSASDLDPATAGIADELSKQYFLGYPAAAKRDGKWHAIKVEVGKRGLTVRARHGYVATS